MNIFNRVPKDAKLSYAQCGEDVIADFIFSNLKPGAKTGKYIDIGAHHPTFLSNTYLFYKKNWRGINIDPIEENMRLFKRVRPKDINICAAIGGITENRDFYIMDAPALSTSDKDVVERYQSMGHKIRRIDKIQFMSLDDLIAQYRIKNDIDMLSLDIEGDELLVMNNLIKWGIYPKIIICETVNYAPRLADASKADALVQEIVSLGYFMYADTFINSIFVLKEFLS